LHRFLAQQRANYRVLVLEMGQEFSHQARLARRKELEFRDLSDYFLNRTPEKQWVFQPAFGGGSNCWMACTPRMMPEDFQLKSTYGVGEDWPFSYDELEPYYCDAEDLMGISGDSERSPYPRSRPYPQLPHRFSKSDDALRDAFPGEVFSHPCARSPGAVPGQRPACCNNSACRTCPIDAKFTIQNGFKELYRDPRVRVLTSARVTKVDTTGDQVTSIAYESGGLTKRIGCDLAVLGANALFNPHILQRSGFEHPELGTGLCEQVSRSAFIDLKGLNNYQGSTISNALIYKFHRNRDRGQTAAALVQCVNGPPELRNERGKWLQRMRLNFIYEDFRLPENRVELADEAPDKPATVHTRRSVQTNHGLDSMESDLQQLLEALPHSSYSLGDPWRTDSHIMGTTPMGIDPASSIVDGDCIHHRYRNLVILGSGVFPTAAPANPTLTLSAVSLRSADRIA
jgi:choline dehydrogenase-like flavoprotein